MQNLGRNICINFICTAKIWETIQCPSMNALGKTVGCPFHGTLEEKGMNIDALSVDRSLGMQLRDKSLLRDMLHGTFCRTFTK